VQSRSRRSWQPKTETWLVGQVTNIVESDDFVIVSRGEDRLLIEHELVRLLSSHAPLPRPVVDGRATRRADTMLLALAGAAVASAVLAFFFWMRVPQ
jgi:hypothetical protein